MKVAEGCVQIFLEQEVGLLVFESEIYRVEIEKLLPAPVSLFSLLGDGRIQPLSEMNHK